MIHNLDRNIIVALSKNGRLSNARLARQLGVSISTIAKRVNYLLKEEIIVVRAVPNPYRMGYRISAVIALDVDLVEVSHICDKLIDNTNISLIITTFGRFDVLLIVDFTNWNMLHDFLRDELYPIKGVREVEISFVSEMTKRYQGLFDEGFTTPEPSIDDVDMEIIKELHKDGRLSYNLLVDKLGLSATTISRRVSFLCKQNIIKIIAIPNVSFMGYLSNAYLGLHVEYEKIDSICAQITRYSCVHLTIKLLNGYDILVGVNCETPEMLYEFIRQEIAHIDGIDQIETIIRAEIRKRLYDVEFIKQI